MSSGLKGTLWVVLGIVISCLLVKDLFYSLIGRNSFRDGILAPIIIDEPIHECSISPGRNFVLTKTLVESHSYQKIYNLKTGDEVEYPAPLEANSYGSNAYHKTLGWINDSTQDIVLVDPYWLVNLTTGVVTKTKKIDSQQPSWWEPLLMPDDREPYVKSPDQQYVAESGRISRPATAKSPVGESIVSYSNNYPEICSNAWEPDSSGYYFADVYWRVRTSGPLRFLKNPER